MGLCEGLGHLQGPMESDCSARFLSNPTCRFTTLRIRQPVTAPPVTLPTSHPGTATHPFYAD